MSSKKLTIGEKAFKAHLAEKYVALMESERGMQSKLADSVGKKSNFFSAIKRGNPVNAVHLKAVELVCGPEKVIELLTISEEQADTIKILDFVPHSQIIQDFKQKELARELNLNALKLEKLNPEALKEINNFIKFKLQHEEEKIEEPKAVSNGEKK